MEKEKKVMKRKGLAAVSCVGRERLRRRMIGKSSGIDGLLVTVGLCIIALLLCVVMKEKLETFIGTIMDSLTQKAIQILG